MEIETSFPGVHRLRIGNGYWSWIGDLPHPEDLLNAPGGLIRVNGHPAHMWLRWHSGELPTELLEGG